MIVVALIKSIPMMADVFVLAVFYFTIFGIACVELFIGKLDRRCGVPDFSYAYTDGAGFVQVRRQGVAVQGVGSAQWAVTCAHLRVWQRVQVAGLCACASPRVFYAAALPEPE